MNDKILHALRDHAANAIADLPEGEPLDPVSRALIELGLAVSVTSLHSDGTRSTLSKAFDAGASLDQIEEIIALVSGLGVHSLMFSQAMVLAEAGARGLIDPQAPLNAERQALWDRYVGTDPFWNGFERENPGFLDAMLRLCPAQFSAFFEYCAVPWKIGSVRAVVKELAAMACDIAPTHAFGPGFRVHLANAKALGASRAQITQALDLAAATASHAGIA
jgi:alkylhydroperoxidase/carboxymuconolactone decarboxylase family protein YurZ